MNRCRVGFLIVPLILIGCNNDAEIELVAPSFTDMVSVPDEVVANSGQRGTFANADGSPIVLFLNYDGVTITKANASDAAANLSFVGGGTVPAFPGTQTQRDEVTALVVQLYAAFNIQVVTSRPASGNYDMAVIGGSPSSIALNAPAGVAGVAPMDCGNKMPRDIAFVFAGAIQNMVASSGFVRVVAETTAHEAAHTYGLPHSGDACDLMSYGQCSQIKTFRDQQMSMQSDSYGQCGLTSMNSYQMLASELGSDGTTPTPPPTTDPPPTTPPTVDNTPPQVTITSPAAGATVTPQVTIKSTVTDDVAVQQVGLYIDNQLVAAKSSAPYEFSGTLATGQRTIVVAALDTNGNQGNSQPITITVSNQPATPPTPPPTTEPTPEPAPEPTPQEPEPTAPEPEPTPEPSKGSYGDACDGPDDCITGLCAADPDSDAGNYCTEECNPDGAACPSDAACQISNVDLAVCSAPDPDAKAPNAADVDETLSSDPGELVGGCSINASGPTPPLSLVLICLICLTCCLRRRFRS